jgi:hypothetical protein
MDVPNARPGAPAPGFCYRIPERIDTMARKPGTRNSGEFALFDVVYEDGSQRSNRKVPLAVLGGLDGDEPARAVISEQDSAITRFAQTTFSVRTAFSVAQRRELIL